MEGLSRNYTDCDSPVTVDRDLSLPLDSVRRRLAARPRAGRLTRTVTVSSESPVSSFPSRARSAGPARRGAFRRCGKIAGARIIEFACEGTPRI